MIILPYLPHILAQVCLVSVKPLLGCLAAPSDRLGPCLVVPHGVRAIPFANSCCDLTPIYLGPLDEPPGTYRFTAPVVHYKQKALDFAALPAPDPQGRWKLAARNLHHLLMGPATSFFPPQAPHFSHPRTQDHVGASAGSSQAAKAEFVLPCAQKQLCSSASSLLLTAKSQEIHSYRKLSPQSH